MNKICTSLSLLLISCTAFAGEPAPQDPPPSRINEPIFFFELPNRGALAVQLDNLAIRAGTSGSLKNAKSSIEMAAAAKGTLSVSCKDSHSALAIEKALSSFPAESLQSLSFLLLAPEKCSEAFRAAILATGARL